MSAPAAPAQLPVLALLGRPNVGKSTLFNILTQGEKALTHATAGTTRDVRTTPGRLFTLGFTLLDTAGLEEGRGQTELQLSLNQLAKNAADAADVMVLVIDGASGLVPADRALAQHLRKKGKPVVVVLNKADLKTAESHLPDVEALGFGAPVLLSAAHSMGLDDLFDALQPHLPEIVDEPAEEHVSDEAEDETGEGDEEPEFAHPVTEDDAPLAANEVELPSPLKIALLGRPNVGKSTLLNKLLGQEKMLTGPTAGLTREAISHPFSFNGHEITLIDTPGLRKKANVVENLEELSVGQSLQAATRADVAILVVDVSSYSIEDGTWQVFEQQDARIAQTILNAGTPLVVAMNKWDAVADKENCKIDTLFQLKRRLHQLAAPVGMPISAQRGKGLNELLEAALNLARAHRTRTGTAKLNRLLAKALARRSPPLTDSGHTVNIKYVTQVATQPPTLALWGTRTDQLPNSYKTFLRNDISAALDLGGVPVRLVFRRSHNPYQFRAKKPGAKSGPSPKRPTKTKAKGR